MTTIVDSNLPVARPSWVHSRLESRIVHLGCGAFHRAHQALYTHHLLESTDSDWGICEVNLMPGNDRVLIDGPNTAEDFADICLILDLLIIILN